MKLSRAFWDLPLYRKSESLTVFALFITSLSQRDSSLGVLGSLQLGCFSAAMVGSRKKSLTASLQSCSTWARSWASTLWALIFLNSCCSILPRGFIWPLVYPAALVSCSWAVCPVALVGTNWSAPWFWSCLFSDGGSSPRSSNQSLSSISILFLSCWLLKVGLVDLLMLCWPKFDLVKVSITSSSWDNLFPAFLPRKKAPYWVLAGVGLRLHAILDCHQR